ncbi:MAG: glycoside hydrolase family 43 protein [Porphyromonadaceae bacterium]|nr:glycoside hydrolase family 43 protein [Porphyromonadaceae bacterium]
MRRKRVVSLVLAFCASVVSLCGQGFRNPILPGFHPDPSVCRVGDDYYLVNSSFQYFPGVPIHHSKDLVHWESIGYCLTRESQLKLDRATFGGGIYAPTIRVHEGRFYMVTNVSDRGNFYVYTDNPAEEWSDPIWVNRPGIDPDLFFDDDGRCYFLSTSDDLLQVCEIDILTGELLSEPHVLWGGTGGRYPEGPHLYKKDGYYYLMIAEGGTEYGHKVTIARSRSLYGPYESNPANPILTHANASGAHSPIQGTGHADLIEAHDGSWWMVFLAFRPQSYNHHLLGRETYLAPVRWNEEGWPVVNGDGTVSLEMDCPTLPSVEFPTPPVRDDFTEQVLGDEWNTLCRPHPEEITLSERPGWLRLHASTVTLDQPDSPVFLGRRQEDISFSATTLLDFSGLQEGAEAGITTYMSTDYRYDLSVVRREEGAFLTLNYRLGLLHHREAEIPLEGNIVYLRVEGKNDRYSYRYSLDGAQYESVGSMDTRFLSSETAGGFTGIYLGLFAQSRQQDTSTADFDWFDYAGEP